MGIQFQRMLEFLHGEVMLALRIVDLRQRHVDCRNAVVQLHRLLAVRLRFVQPVYILLYLILQSVSLARRRITQRKLGSVPVDRCSAPSARSRFPGSVVPLHVPQRLEIILIRRRIDLSARIAQHVCCNRNVHQLRQFRYRLVFQRREVSRLARPPPTRPAAYVSCRSGSSSTECHFHSAPSSP